jgi:hypothetical protein
MEAIAEVSTKTPEVTRRFLSIIAFASDKAVFTS